MEIIPAQLSSGGAKWLEDVNTFKQGPRGWVGLTARVIPCLGSELVNVFSSRSGTRTTIAFQTFTELPAGTTMARIEMDVVFLQDRGAQEVSVYVLPLFLEPSLSHKLHSLCPSPFSFVLRLHPSSYVDVPRIGTSTTLESGLAPKTLLAECNAVHGHE